MRVGLGSVAIAVLLLAGCSGDDTTAEPDDALSITADPSADDAATDDASANGGEPDAVRSLQDWIEANDAGGDWVDGVVAWVFTPPRMFLDGDFDPERAERACEAVLGWIADGGAAEATTIRDRADSVRVDGADGVCAPA